MTTAPGGRTMMQPGDPSCGNRHHAHRRL